MKNIVRNGVARLTFEQSFLNEKFDYIQWLIRWSSKLTSMIWVWLSRRCLILWAYVSSRKFFRTLQKADFPPIFFYKIYNFYFEFSIH